MATTVSRSKSKKFDGPKVDPYDLVTNRIIEALEAGVVPWHKPWKASTDGPMSLSTKKPYRGINVFVLDATRQQRGYDSRWWVTFNQAKERGGSVRKGEKAGKVTDRIPFLRYFTVFNLDQCDDVPAPTEAEVAEFNPIEECERISAGYISGPTIKYGGNQAYYSPSLDYIQMPKPELFVTPEYYYGTLFHEQAHSTGHESRLDRSGITALGRFGDENYSREELIAEMTSAFVCGEAGIPVNVQHHAGYIQSWLRALKGDKKLVVQAAGAAQKAADLIVGASAPAVAADEEVAA
jgi:antirestriction protein ArdC